MQLKLLMFEPFGARERCFRRSQLMRSMEEKWDDATDVDTTKEVTREAQAVRSYRPEIDMPIGLARREQKGVFCAFVQGDLVSGILSETSCDASKRALQAPDCVIVEGCLEQSWCEK